MAAPMEEECDCSDFMKFQEALKRMRKVDDGIIHALNTAVPTQSFSKKVNVTETCKTLYEQLMQIHQIREKAIKKCILETADKINELNKKQANDMDNIELHKELRSEQAKLRLIKSEMLVDEVVNDRTLKALYERCGTAYKFPTKPIL